MTQAPRFAIYWKWKGGATRIELDARAALSELEANDLVQAPAGANSSTTSGFAARVLNAKTPYDHDGDGLGNTR